MIKSLEIKDYALIEHIQIEFFPGLNIITGETGAGKSILIDAMGLLLGDRASSEIVRKGATKSFVEGIFDVSDNTKVKSILDENEIDFQNELIIRREISQKGNNRCFVNDSPVSLNVIKELGDILVDLHGQHEHQSLLRTETHIDFLDNYSNNQSILKEYQIVYSKIKSKEKELKDLLAKEQSIKEKREIYQFQLNEIESVNPQPYEDENINNELNILENSEKLLQLSEEIYNLLYESDNSVLDQLAEVKNKLSQLIKIDSSLSELESEFDSVSISLKEISSSIRKYRNQISIEPEEVEAKRERLNSINLLKKKYGLSIENVLAYKEKISKEIALAENFSDEINKIKKEIFLLKETLYEIANKLSTNRKKNSSKVESEVKSVLKNLGINSPSFEIRFSAVESDDFFEKDKSKIGYNIKGIDNVEFFISTNPGEDLKPLIKVASGGEISRIMLALKTALAKNDKLPLLVFDEIDTGISGRVAQKVGQALLDLAKYHQIIAITHLPQIAAFAEHHFVVEKIQSDDRSVSQIKYLSEEERIFEIAKLLSGEQVTQTSLESARQLINSK
ncbi:MAG: DNA repair protein RecN [Ignavibacterium sp.]|nr:DNA repair protein RecN [Ignavibacterium sp.]MDW8375803.1 DNA repair protein RecN [Ignavibacteriales bacterium]